MVDIISFLITVGIWFILFLFWLKLLKKRNVSKGNITISAILLASANFIFVLFLIIILYSIVGDGAPK